MNGDRKSNGGPQSKLGIGAAGRPSNGLGGERSSGQRSSANASNSGSGSAAAAGQPSSRLNASGSLSRISASSAASPPTGQPSAAGRGGFNASMPASLNSKTSPSVPLGSDNKKTTAAASTAGVTASLSRTRLASSFRTTGSTFTTALGSMQAKSRPQPTPVEYQYVLDDITLTYGHSSFQGARDYQEDTVACVPLPTGLAGGVFDGHGGDDVSKELERVLLQNINRQITDVSARFPDDIRAMQTAIHNAYVGTNNDIGIRMDAAMEAGSCAVTVFVTRVSGKPYLLCANAGDCRAVLYTQMVNGTRRAVRLTEDHKPQPNVCPSEITRINDAGGCVLWGRVQGCLAVSRAFGDRTLQPYVIADPHVLGRPLDPDADQFLYLASDGVTDMVDDNTGCAVVLDALQRGNNATQAAAALVSAAYQKGSCDNISVLLIRVRRRQPGDKTGPVQA